MFHRSHHAGLERHHFKSFCITLYLGSTFEIYCYVCIYKQFLCGEFFGLKSTV